MERKKTSKLQSVTASIVVQRILVVVMLCWFVIFLVVPVLMIFSKVFTDTQGNYVGLENFKTYFANPLLRQSIGHSLWVSLITAVSSTLLGFLFAYGITRTNMKCRTLFQYLGMLSLFLPTMVHGMALVYLFGAKGFFYRDHRAGYRTVWSFRYYHVRNLLYISAGVSGSDYCAAKCR